jgi:4-hydroxy-tetrahydrodipicolinate synthase
LSSDGALASRLCSVVATIVTPFDPEGRVDERALQAIAERMVDAGIEVVVPCGNTGEFSSLSLDEAKRVTRIVVKAIGEQSTVVAGVGWSLPIALELARDAEGAGAHAVMVHHPVHTYIDRRALRAYYEQLVDGTGIGVVLYKRGPELTDELIAQLVLNEGVVGVKYAVNDLNAFANLVDSSDADVAWICGTAERWAPFFHLAGAGGFTSGLANFAPGQALALRDALEARDYERAMQIRAELTGLEELRQGKHSGNNVPVVKEALHLLGLADRAVREPLAELEPVEKLLVREIVERWNLSPAAVA